MPQKINIYRSHGEKIISLFARLLFSGKSFSLTELASFLNCSKATVLRLIESIKMSYSVTVIEDMRGNRKYFSIKKPSGLTAAITMSDMEIQILQMCRAFAENLLGQQQFEDATRGILKSFVLLDQKDKKADEHFAAFRSGRIDYTPHQSTLKTLIEAMEKKQICVISYQRIMAKRAKVSYIKPLKVFSHHETVYLHARYARVPGKPYKESKYDPLFAIHRFKSVELTERQFEIPENYNFEKVFNQAFGIMDGKPFDVKIEFSGKPAEYVAERIWSNDQKIIDLGNGKINLIFSSSSKVELIPWVLAFAEYAKVVKPDWLVDEIKSAAKQIVEMYK